MSSSPLSRFWKALLSVLFYLSWSSLIIGVVGVLWWQMGVRQVEGTHRITKTMDTTELQKVGTYGDSFGYVNSLFSGLAFGGVIFAIVLQTMELSLQRKELEDTREELKKSGIPQKQLVSLNTLSAITQYHLQIFNANPHEHKREYVEALRNDPAKLARTTLYKVETCTRMLEQLYLEITGNARIAPRLVG